MIFKFIIISDEVDNFFREICIDSEATFLDLNNSILESVSYTKDEMTSFFICDEDWEKNTEITLVEMDTDPEFDSWVMKDTKLSDLLEEEKQKLLFVFDYMTERSFFIELIEMLPEENIENATCTKSEGEAPKQIANFDFFEKENERIDTGENFYGDEEFEVDEIDEDGFDITDGGTGIPNQDNI